MINGEPYSQRAEAWLVGCMVYHLLFKKQLTITKDTLKTKALSKAENYTPTDYYSVELKNAMECLLRIDQTSRLNFRSLMINPRTIFIPLPSQGLDPGTIEK